MLRIPEITEEIKRRFFKYVEKTDGCWEWTGYRISHRENRCYGRIKIGGINILAHRLSFLIHKGPIPQSCGVLHSCDNPRCVNPEHLFAGTQFANARDMVNKGRVAIGESNGQSKLTWEQVREIRSKYIPGVYTTRRLAKEYDVSGPIIYRIVTHVIWKERQ